jgi:hypothetical protein
MCRPQQQPAPNPPGTTTQPISRTRDASSEQHICRRTPWHRRDTRHGTLETAALLRCSLPAPSSNNPMLATPHPTTCTMFKDYVKTLPTWEQDLLLSVTEKPSTVPLYELLNQTRTPLLAVCDSGADVPNNYGSFGWVLGTNHEILWECKGITRGNPMQSYRAEGYDRISLLSFLTHYMLYLDIQPSEDLCITSYFDNHSLLKNEEKFYTGDINSSSWYMNPDHDVIMSLSALRTKLRFRWHRYTFALIKMDTATSTYSRDLHNSTFLPTNSLPKHSRHSAQRDNLQNSTHFPHAAPTCVMA